VERPSIPRYRRIESNGSVVQRDVFWRDKGGFRKTRIYTAAALGPRERVAGPAVVQMPETAVVVPPGTSGSFDQYGNFVLNLEH